MKKILCTSVMVLLFISANHSQQASDYFPADTGHKWKFKLTLLDSLNQPVPSAVTFKVDSFALTAPYFGSEAKYIVSKTGAEDLLPLLPYTDSIFLNLSGTEAFEYYRNGGFSSIIALLDSLGLDSSFSFLNLFQSFQGWYSKYRLTSNINANYQIFSFDTSITFDSTTLPLRFEFRGKRRNDESLVTQIGNFNCKKFVMSNVISYLVTFPPFPTIAIPILTFNDSVWVAPSNWIVKEFAPSTNIDLSIFGFPVITIPGYTSELMSIPTEVDDMNSVLTDFHLNQNYPNPFNPSTIIEYSVPARDSYNVFPAFVELKVFDILGTEITTLVSSFQSPGNYRIMFDTGVGTKNILSLAGGVYFYRLQISDHSGLSKRGLTEIKKMIYLK